MLLPQQLRDPNLKAEKVKIIEEAVMGIASLNIDYSKKKIVGKVNGQEPDETGNLEIPLPTYTEGYEKTDIDDNLQLQKAVIDMPQIINGPVLLKLTSTYSTLNGIELFMRGHTGSGVIIIDGNFKQFSEDFGITFEKDCAVPIMLQNLGASTYTFKSLGLPFNPNKIVLNSCTGLDGFELRDKAFITASACEVYISAGNNFTNEYRMTQKARYIDAYNGAHVTSALLEELTPHFSAYSPITTYQDGTETSIIITAEEYPDKKSHIVETRPGLGYIQAGAYIYYPLPLKMVEIL
jgi:hypothetical protein